MQGPRHDGVFIIGTDTGVGKTSITVWLARWLQQRKIAVGVCKPAVTGAAQVDGQWVWDDVYRLQQVDSSDPALLAPIRWRLPLAPSVADRVDRDHRWTNPPIHPARAIELDDYLFALQCRQRQVSNLLVEGVGGLLCPLTHSTTLADLVVAWGRPALLVSRAGLGALNHTLLTIEAARSRGIAIAGIVLNHATPPCDSWAERTNPDELRRRTDIPVLGPIEFSNAPNPPATFASIPWLDFLGWQQGCERRDEADDVP